MHIRIANNADQEAWDAYVLNHPKGLAYHLYAWRAAVENAYGFEALYILAEADGRVCGIFPLIRFKNLGGGCSYISLPFCDVAGPLGDSQHINNTLREYAVNLSVKDNVTCEVRYSATSVADSVSSYEKVRMVLALPDSSEALMTGFKSKLRSQVRKPLKDGLSAQIGGKELVASFYSVFARNMRDLGSPVHSLEWIYEVVDKYGENARVAIVYTPDNISVAAGIILLHKETVSIPWASSLREFNKLNPNMLLYWTFLSFAADNGYRYFDFGRSTPGEGTFKFKAQWGATPQPLNWVRYPLSCNDNKRVAGIPTSKPRIFAAKVWRRLPLFVVNFLGPKLRKHISL